MIRRITFQIIAALFVMTATLRAAASGTGKDAVFYVGSGAETVFHDVLTLPDGSILVAGGSDSLDWVPQSTKRIKLEADKVNGQPGGPRVAFVLHVSPDLRRVLHVAEFPPGTADDVRRLRNSGVPGSGKVGDLFLSITTKENRVPDSGYAIVKLDGNFVDRVPKEVAWVHNVWAGRDHREIQPWDVGADGKIVYAIGVSFAPDWAAIQRLTADGKDDVVDHWRYHMGTSADGARVDGHWTPASSRKDVRVRASAMVFKISRPDLRSWTAEDYNATEDDGNGKTRQGRWPNDLFYAVPGTPDDPNAGNTARGYTGYSPGKNQTHRIGAIAIDRRDNSMYVGYSIQSRLPDGQPDFEPAVIAFDSDGKLRWWSRLYHQTPQNSTPDQYIDGLAVDYAGDRLVVGARAHGNNVINLWDGSNSFKNKLNGKTGNVHISWLGGLQIKSGKFINSAWFSELADTTKGLGKPLSSGLLAGWPDPNGGWADMNTTRLRALTTDPSTGDIIVVGTGRRPYTTTNAYQQMFKPNEGISAWSDFARVYKSDFSSLLYSTVLNGKRSPQEEGKRVIELNAIAPQRRGAIIAVGRQAKGISESAPVADAPEWASDSPTGAAVLARFVVQK